MTKISPVFVGGLALVALTALGFGVYTAFRPAENLAMIDANSSSAEATATPYQSLGDQEYAESLPTAEPAPVAAVTKSDADTETASKIPDANTVLTKNDDNPVSGTLDAGDLFHL